MLCRTIGATNIVDEISIRMTRFVDKICLDLVALFWAYLMSIKTMMQIKFDETEITNWTIFPQFLGFQRIIQVWVQFYLNLHFLDFEINDIWGQENSRLHRLPYYCGLKISTGRKYYGPLCFTCGVKITVAYISINYHYENMKW